jgi:hypothetical protein
MKLTLVGEISNGSVGLTFFFLLNVGRINLPLIKNVVVFIETKSGGGIEAWVNLKE